MAGAMTEIRDEICSISVFYGSSWSVYVLLLCVCVSFLLLFLYLIYSFLYALCGHFVFYVCHKMTALEEFNPG